MGSPGTGDRLMAGKGPPPKAPTERRRRNEPVHEWKPSPGVGWQHGEMPKPPTKMVKAARDAWAAWMGSWFASHWKPEDLPGLRQVIRLYDQVERGEFQRHGELRLAMDTYGITPKGQQDRRWQPPEEEQPPAAGQQRPAARYGHLRSMPGGA